MRVICERPRNQTLHARAGRKLAAILRAVGSADRDQRPFNCSSRGDRNITYSVCQPSCVRWLRGKQRDRGSASKIPYSLLREVPPLRRAHAEFCHAQAPDWRLLEETHRIERSFGFAISGRRLPLFSRLRGAIQTVCAVEIPSAGSASGSIFRRAPNSITECGSGGSYMNPIVQSPGKPDRSLTAGDFSRPLHLRQRAIQRFVREAEFAGEVLDATWQDDGTALGAGGQIVANAIARRVNVS